MELVIGNKNYSSWSLRPWLLLNAHQVTFKEINVSLSPDGLKKRLGSYSATCKVPVLIDQELIIWDSLAICEYISETCLGGQGWPSNIQERAIARAICCELHSGFMALRSELPLNCRAKKTVQLSPSAQLDIQRIDDIFSTYAEQNADGELRLFAHFSIADCFYAPIILRFSTYGIELSDRAQAYADSMLKHPSLIKWSSQADKELETLMDYEL
jgi:glutathione S-transferase